jgi:glycosyltransferase involved in cell wall biosynthesis
LVSCLCITHRRVPMLRRAVECFLAQTWPRRELLVVHEDVDTGTRDFLAQLDHPLIRSQVVPATPHLPLGAKRQISLEAARGRYIATWDDDDWSAPNRLAEQMQVIRESGLPACVMQRWVVYDQVLQQAWLSGPYTWEASLVAERAAMPAYEPHEKGEDLASMKVLIAAGHVSAIRSPHLYIYRYHGGNVGSRIHFKRNVFAHAKPLSSAFARRVAALLSSAAEPPLALDELRAALPQGGRPG